MYTCASACVCTRGRGRERESDGGYHHFSAKKSLLTHATMTVCGNRCNFLVGYLDSLWDYQHIQVKYCPISHDLGWRGREESRRKRDNTY